MTTYICCYMNPSDGEHKRVTTDLREVENIILQSFYTQVYVEVSVGNTKSKHYFKDNGKITWRN